jgi:PhnB protein
MNSVQGVIPYLAFNGQAGAAADLYVRVFSAVDQGRMPTPDRPGRFLHIQLEINGGSLMLCDHGDVAENVDRGGHLQLVLADAPALWERALSAGMTVICPYEKQFWGDEWGLLVDEFGIHWGIMQFEPGPCEAS